MTRAEFRGVYEVRALTLSACLWLCRALVMGPTWDPICYWLLSAMQCTAARSLHGRRSSVVASALVLYMLL